MHVFHHVLQVSLKTGIAVNSTHKIVEQDSTLMQVEILVQIAPPYVNNVQELMINVQPVTAIMFWMETNVNQRMCVLQENI